MIKQILVSSCVLFSATFVVQAQNPKLGVSPIQDVINAMTLDEKIQLVVGSTGKYETRWRLPLVTRVSWYRVPQVR